MQYIRYINTPIGKLSIIEEENQIIKININQENEKREIVEKEIIEKETPVLKEAERQFNEYFNGTRKNFELPIKVHGTEFMKEVWNALLKITYAETKTYGEIAKEINHPKAARAVGMANHRNVLPIIIPCHRVIGVNEKLVGYALGLQIKQWLLDFEKKNINK